jgi:LysM repeat protein
LFLISACGSSPKHVSTSKDSKKNNHAKRGSQTYVPGTGEENTLEDIIYNSLGHRKGSGVRYSQYIEQNGKFDIPVTYNDAVNKWIDYFTGAGRGHFERYLARSGRFVPYMHAVLDQYNLPKDLVYLSMIESGFNTRAMSWAAAGGLWQFIRSTGSMYGLSSDYYVDERADVEKSTHAAARHLKDLYDEFGDWYLAFAAYNAGAGKVRNAIARDGSSFWDMARGRYLRQETKDYVPKILAAAIIGKNPRKYGFNSVEYQLPIDYERVPMRSATDLEVAAECAGVEPDLIRLLNPELLRDMTPPQISNYQLKIPRGTKSRFLQRYLALSPSQRLKTVYYTVQRGDTVREIAGNYGVSERDLVGENSGKVDVDKDRRSKTERVAVRKGKKTKFVKKKVTYTVVSYHVDPGTVLAIPKNRSVARNASSRDDAAAHAAKYEFGLKLAAAEPIDAKGKKKKDKKKPEKETLIARAELPESAQPEAAQPTDQSPAEPVVADDAGSRPVLSDLDSSLEASDPRAGDEGKIDEGKIAVQGTGEILSGPVALNDRPSDVQATAGMPVQPSDAEMKAAVESLRPKSDEPAVESDPAAAPKQTWVPEAEAKKAAATKKAAPKVARQHVVKPGENLTTIAAHYRLSVQELTALNAAKLKNGNLLVGTKLALGGAATGGSAKVAKAGVPAKRGVVKYKVQPGDNLIKIAKQHATTPQEIQRLNGLKGAKIVPGAVLVVKN